MSKSDSLRDELAENHGVGIANPVLRSMISSMSRGAYAVVLANSFKAGWDARGAEVKRLREALEIIADSNHGKDCDLIADKVAKLALAETGDE